MRVSVEVDGETLTDQGWKAQPAGQATLEGASPSENRQKNLGRRKQRQTGMSRNLRGGTGGNLSPFPQGVSHRGARPTG